jgi:glycosyltransferase involved in cell wall biosynthesis
VSAARVDRIPRIVHVTADVIPELGSVYTALPRLCGLLRSRELDVELLTTHAPGTATRTELRNGFPVTSFPKDRWGGYVGKSSAMAAALGSIAGQSALFHVHAVWRICSLDVLHFARRHGLPAILSPTGAFAPAALRHSRFRKLAFWHAVQKQALGGVTCFHATSQAEHDDIRSLGLRGPIAVIPLGVDIPTAQPEREAASPQRTVLFLGRISPIKNVLSLVRAWTAIQARFPDARLRIVGPDDRGHVETVRQAVENSGAERVSIGPGVWGTERDQAYREADLIVLPSHSESFGLVVAEALAVGRPVIASTGSPWQVLQRESCGWWVDPTAEALAGAMAEALSLPDHELKEMGSRGRMLAERELSWSNRVPSFHQMYEWVLGGGSPPAFVST